ncbi:MAG: symmetrical bis(5'-nucleosyl)-tetraphosphatase, partial [Gammaproteobacteria bacterium]|nr:symmetrical bis(5'-nucleosyl)-tetraphosphatase [Gammaproteobacteria bacterium]
MSTFAIGDIQGCHNDLLHLLKEINYRPDKDKLWFAGDLVNRGPDSLETLLFVKSLGEGAVTVLGNHDLHLLALSEGNIKHKSQDHTLDSILDSPKREELIHWLRHQPLMHHDSKKNISLIHAGLPPQWDLQTALACAREVEETLQGDGFHDYCMQMYGNQPDLWSDNLVGMDRLRFITNCFSRLRYCDIKGQLAMKEKGTPGTQVPSVLPWFEIPGRATQNERILFGHWSTLG